MYFLDRYFLKYIPNLCSSRPSSVSDEIILNLFSRTSLRHPHLHHHPHHPPKELESSHQWVLKYFSFKLDLIFTIFSGFIISINHCPIFLQWGERKRTGQRQFKQACSCSCSCSRSRSSPSWRNLIILQQQPAGRSMGHLWIIHQAKNLSKVWQSFYDKR